jgi:hypothetical protein
MACIPLLLDICDGAPVARVISLQHGKESIFGTPDNDAVELMHAPVAPCPAALSGLS